MEVPPAHKPLRVMVTDDAAPVRQHLVAMLSDLSNVEIVAEAENVAGTLETVQKTRPDVVVLDIQLPDGSGIDALKKIKHDWPETRVIMLTNHANPLYRRACVRAGASFFFDKSTEFERVSEILGTMTNS